MKFGKGDRPPELMRGALWRLSEKEHKKTPLRGGESVTAQNMYLGEEEMCLSAKGPD